MVSQFPDLPAVPPLDGSVTVLPGFVDFQAKHNPEKPCAVFPSSTSPTGVDSVTFKEFAKATHRVAHAVRPGRKGEEGEVVGVVIHTDALLYMALLAGMARAGLVSFPMSPRNSVPAIVNMLEKTSCHRIITQSSLSPLISEVKADLEKKGYALQVDELPALQDVFPELSTKTNGMKRNETKELKPYPSRTKPVDMNAPLTYLHSSGSTGFPKPIPQTQNTFLSWSRGDIMSGARTRQVQYASMALPTFHSLAFSMQFLIPFVTSSPVALYEPKYPSPPVVPSAQNVLQVSMLTGSTGIPAVPSMIETWAQSDEAIDYLATLQIVMYAGGPLSKKAGDLLVSRGVKLTSVYGGTEFGTTTLAYYPERREDAPYDIRSPEDWEWMQMGPQYKTRWIPQGDGTYELHILTTPTHQLAVENLPDVKGYATSDLWEPHPIKEGLWKIIGRTDDVIILSSGEKIVPIPQESHIGTNPMVKGVLIFGRGREQAGVLIEPAPEYAVDPDDEDALTEFRNKIWPTVEEANQLAPAFGRIFKEMIIVTPPSRALPRPAKGTIARKQAVKEFEDEIQNLYLTVENSSGTKDIVPPKSWRDEDVESWLLEHAASVNDGRPVNPAVDLFEQGVDSLGATFLRNRIIGALRGSKGTYAQQAATRISQNFVFDYPTIRTLAQAICTLVDPSSAAPQEPDILDEIKEMITKYGSGMRVIERRDAIPQDRVVVLLTGTTGNIGSHILAALLADDCVAKVYGLNRSGPSGEIAKRQRAAFQDRGLPLELLSSGKFVPLAGDLTSDRFGLEGYFEEIKETVTHIIHNAWTVHFKHPLSSFEEADSPAICLFNLGRTEMASIRTVRLPELPLAAPEVAAVNGYAASKYVAEQLLAKASTNGLVATSLRVGQVCGSKATGAWNTTDWVPILVKSSLSVGCLPALEGSASWVPMDAVANLTLDLIFSADTPPPLVNVVHPHPVTWLDIFGAIDEVLGNNLPFVPMSEWVGKLEVLASDLGSQKHLDKVPALNLLEFYRGLARASKHVGSVQAEAGGIPLFQTAELRRYSPTMDRLPRIDQAYAKAWVDYWRSKGYL
ncbi:hypothetical protein NM688_g2383 [Phlebia brevispora]|uniref:Uncharacterized protein n=1 Tax=Phlebia brevispora TaxID=194682 RepID=A0ACC1T908_9APHY|nr:hypothetical protein NM688_g2383 [Phlebia brevispora]